MIVSWPGVVTPNTRCDKYLIIEDFYPTILEMAGITTVSYTHLDVYKRQIQGDV